MMSLKADEDEKQSVAGSGKTSDETGRGAFKSEGWLIAIYSLAAFLELSLRL
jgi:hypothetical protein